MHIVLPQKKARLSFAKLKSLYLTNIQKNISDSNAFKKLWCLSHTLKYSSAT